MTNLDVAMDETVDYVFGEFEDFIETTREHHSFHDVAHYFTFEMLV